MKYNHLTMFQIFNAMRLYMATFQKKTDDDDIGLLLSGMKLANNFPDWRKNPQTWDPPAWGDWMDGVHKTLQNLNIVSQNPLSIAYNEEIAFLCMKNYLNLFYKQFSFEGVKKILQIINAVQIGSKNDPEWNYFLDCIQMAIDQEPNILA